MVPRFPTGGTIRRSCKITQPSENFTCLPSAPQTSSTSTPGLGCTLCCDTRVTPCKLSDSRVKVFFFLAGSGGLGDFVCDLQFSAARRQISACFFFSTNICRQDILRASTSDLYLCKPFIFCNPSSTHLSFHPSSSGRSVLVW